MSPSCLPFCLDIALPHWIVTHCLSLLERQIIPAYILLVSFGTYRLGFISWCAHALPFSASHHLSPLLTDPDFLSPLPCPFIFPWLPWPMTSSLTVTRACSATNAKIYLPVSAHSVTAVPEVPHQGEQEWRRLANKAEVLDNKRGQILNIFAI